MAGGVGKRGAHMKGVHLLVGVADAGGEDLAVLVRETRVGASVKGLETVWWSGVIVYGSRRPTVSCHGVPG